MKKFVIALFAVVCLLAPFALKAQKKSARPAQSAQRAIRFVGAEPYSQQELMAAAGLTAHTPQDAATIKARAKQLSDTGLFSAIKLAADAKSISLTLTPTAQLFPLRLENLPLTPGAELEAQLRQRVPLYRGQLPGAGTIVDAVRAELEKMLAAQGVPATVKATLTSGLGPQKITAMNFAVATPAVKIGAIQFVGVSAALQAKARQAALAQSGNDYDTTYSLSNLKRAFEDFYDEQSYPAAKISLQQNAPVMAAQGIAVPFTLSVVEGGVYKLGKIAYPASAVVPRAEVEKVLAKYQAGSGRPLDLFVLAVRDAHHARGYLDCATTTQDDFNETTHIVNYAIDVTPGEVYKFTGVKFDGAPDAMAARLNKLWTLTPGAAYDESFVSGFATLAQKKDKQLNKWMQTLLVTFDVQPNADTHTANVVFHFAKAAQPPAVGPAAPASR